MENSRTRILSQLGTTAVLVIATVAFGSSAKLCAQASTSDTPSQTTHGVAAPHPNQQPDMAAQVGNPPGPNRQLQRLTKMLNLTPDQQQRMLPILVQRRQQMQKIKNNSALNHRQRRRAARSLMRDTRRKMEAVMTDTQKQRFRQMRRRHRKQ